MAHSQQETDAEDDELDDPLCRLCFEVESEPEDPLMAPCKCKGSSRWIHTGCLDDWRRAGVNPRAFTHCIECGFPYRVHVKRRVATPHCCGLQDKAWLRLRAAMESVLAVGLVVSLFVGVGFLFQGLDSDRHTVCGWVSQSYPCYWVYFLLSMVCVSFGLAFVALMVSLCYRSRRHQDRWGYVEYPGCYGMDCYWLFYWDAGGGGSFDMSGDGECAAVAIVLILVALILLGGIFTMFKVAKHFIWGRYRSSMKEILNQEYTVMDLRHVNVELAEVIRCLPGENRTADIFQYIGHPPAMRAPRMQSFSAAASTSVLHHPSHSLSASSIPMDELQLAAGSTVDPYQEEQIPLIASTPSPGETLSQREFQHRSSRGSRMNWHVTFYPIINTWSRASPSFPLHVALDQEPQPRLVMREINPLDGSGDAIVAVLPLSEIVCMEANNGFLVITATRERVFTMSAFVDQRAEYVLHPSDWHTHLKPLLSPPPPLSSPSAPSTDHFIDVPPS